MAMKPGALKIPKEGYAYNPLVKHRNIQCPCGSGKKAKKCHGMFRTITEKDAAAAQAYIDHLKKTGLLD